VKTLSLVKVNNLIVKKIICSVMRLDAVDLSSWHKKVAEELNTEYDDEGLLIGQTHEVVNC